MNDREKIIELIKEAYCCVTCGYGDQDKVMWLLECEIEVNWEDIADHLIANGVVIQTQGEWIVDAWDGDKFITMPYIKHQHSDPYCSECKKHALLNGAENDVTSPYCPNCGAKMKEVE